jgi:proteasome lid subunit RPN8/RPN11
MAIWLDTQGRLITTEILSVGTLTETTVYPREVVKAALKHNACSVVVAHNHPSGVCTPSESDYRLTETLKHALALVGVDLVDHIIVGAEQAKSLNEITASELKDARRRARGDRLIEQQVERNRIKAERRKWREKCRCGRVYKTTPKRLRLSTGIVEIVQSR